MGKGFRKVAHGGNLLSPGYSGVRNVFAVSATADDIRRDFERIKARGAEFTMPPTAVTGSTIAQLKDTCGNLIQISQLARY